MAKYLADSRQVHGNDMNNVLIQLMVMKYVYINEEFIPTFPYLEMWNTEGSH